MLRMELRDRTTIRTAAECEAGMASSFMPFSNCQGPQENAVSDTGISGQLTSLDPWENFVLHWKPAVLVMQQSHRAAGQ